MATWNGICGASADDAKQAGTTVTLNNTQIILSAGTQWAGLRFPGCSIPKGAAITSAILTLELVADNTDPGALVFYGEAADNAAAFTTAASNISGRAMTTANVAWSSGALGNGDKNSPDLAAILTEITGRSGYAAGNAVALILDATGTTSLRFTSYDSSTSLCARLAVVYSAGQPMAARARQVPGMRQRHGQQGW